MTDAPLFNDEFYRFLHPLEKFFQIHFFFCLAELPPRLLPSSLLFLSLLLSETSM